MDTMSSIYDGYHFSRGLIGVYNPFSVCNALANLRLNSYWIASGSNEMLLKVCVNLSTRFLSWTIV